MSYQVLARKWRPRTFAELVGQDHVKRALINGLDNDRLHHAFLFSGTRGVGKTTIARIFAKSLNCEVGVSSQPCGTCTSCKEVDEGRFIDLLEVDAASKTKVDDTRELLDNVQYVPTRGRYKVYLIDEVHMLSAHSFNALLKTLEEPPPHVKFLLATTDPQKLPVTVLSRCLQFHLKRLSVAEITGQLEMILKQESTPFEPPAVDLVARNADGSMRDALSLLDQAISHCGGEVREEEVRLLLGTLDSFQLWPLLNALAEQDGTVLMEVLETISEGGPDYGALLGSLSELLHRIACEQIVPGSTPEQRHDKFEIERGAELFSPEDVQLYYQIAVTGRRDQPLAPDPRCGVEMTLLRMLAFRPLTTVAETAVSSAGSPAKLPAKSRQKVVRSAPVEKTKAETVAAVAAVEEGRERIPGSTPQVNESWDEIIVAAGFKGPVKELAANCSLVESDNTSMLLHLDDGQQYLLTDKCRRGLESGLHEYYGREITVRYDDLGKREATPAAKQQRHNQQRQLAAEQSVESDPVVQSLKSDLGARVVGNSVEPGE